MKLTKDQNKALAAAMRANGDTRLIGWAEAKAAVSAALDLGTPFNEIVARECVTPVSQPKAKPDHDLVWAKAHDAGHDAAEACKPRAMTVGTAKSLFDDSFDTSKPVYHEPEGVCGFAWVNWKGNTSWGRWTASENLSRKDGYYGGQTYWIHDYGQSMERKQAYAHAFAAVLNEHGIKATPMSRMD